MACLLLKRGHSGCVAGNSVVGGGGRRETREEATAVTRQERMALDQGAEGTVVGLWTCFQVEPAGLLLAGTGERVGSRMAPGVGLSGGKKGVAVTRRGRWWKQRVRGWGRNQAFGFGCAEFEMENEGRVGI